MVNRRGALKWTMAGFSAALFGNLPKVDMDYMEKKRQFRHSVSRWCFSKYSLGDLVEICKSLGIDSIELLNAEDYKLVIKSGLQCAIANGSPLGITKGFNNPELHQQLLMDYSRLIPEAADNGVSQVICFSGNRNGISDEQGLEYCLKGLDKVVKIAEENRITLVMELLNSKVDHHDYQCDHTSWGVQLSERLGSPNFRLLYDIYHMQIMEGDVIRTIRENHSHICHYHTAGVPGRNEINASQELNYPAIMTAIAETGFKGYVGQEFVPASSDPVKSLKEAIELCNV